MSSESYNQNRQNQLQLQQQYQYQQNKHNQDQQVHYQQNQMQIKSTPVVAVNNSMSENATSSNVYLTLLGLAESFQQANQHRLTIHCLESILTLKHNDITLVTNFHIQLKTRINLCRLYLKHTVNTNQYVNAHLEKSIILVQNLNANDEYKYEATYLIYKIFQKQKNIHFQMKQTGNTSDLAQLTSLFNIELIKKVLETSASSYPVWHLRLLFLISDILAHEKDFLNAAFFMTIGIDFCAQTRISTYTHILFILCKGLIHLLQRNPAELQSTMQPCASLIESYQTSNINQIESLKIFFLVLQVTYFIQCGQMKSVKNTLKNLQHYVQSLACRSDQDNELISQNPLENFQWLHKDHLGILVYLLTVVHSVQTGSCDKAQKLIEKALLNIQKLKLKEQTLVTQTGSYNSSFITNSLHFMLLENMVRCNIAIGNRCLAIKQIGDLFQICDLDTNLLNSYSPQLHCLIGIYCLAMNLKDQALSQFNQSLKSTSDTDLWLFNAMNSAICYLNTMSTNPNIKNQLLSIMENLMPENIQTQNSALTAFSHFFRALRFFLNANYQQAKLSLKEAILLSNAEELMVIVANSYILMGHTDFLMGQFQESFEELNNGSEIAEKLSDFSLKVYSNTILRDVFKYFNDPREADLTIKYSELEQKLSHDYYEALKMPHHALIEWNTNVSPSHIIANIRRAQTVITTPLLVQQQVSPLVPQQFVQQSHYVQHNSPILNQQIAQSRLMSPQQQVHMIHQQQHQQKMSPQTVNSHNYHNQMNISPSVNYHQQPQQFNQHQQLLMQQQPQQQQPHLIHNQHNHH